MLVPAPALTQQTEVSLLEATAAAPQAFSCLQCFTEQACGLQLSNREM